MTISIPANAAVILQTLEAAGHEAYVVGGCVRDAILGRTPGDWDITTSAKPLEVKKLFRRTIDTGLQHGTVTVMMGKEGYEVTTYRVDGEYEDARHPKSVTFTTSLVEDLQRRDFTINAMAYNPESGLVDEFHGREDLENGIIRCVGKPEDRLNEDALRMLRAIRFSAQLGFEIEEETANAIRRLAPLLTRVSRERVQVELTKLLTSPHPETFVKLYEFGITPQFMPEFDEMMKTGQNTRFHAYSVGEHTIRVMQQVRPDPVLRWTALLHDCAKPACRTVDPVTGADHFKGHGKAGVEKAVRILKELKFDNQTIDQVQKLVLWHDERFRGGKRAVRRCLNQIGPDLFKLLMEVERADNLAKHPDYMPALLAEVDAAEKMFQEVMAEADCFTLKDLAVKGKDLIDAGVKPGREMGAILQEMLEYVMDHPEANEKETLLKWWRGQ